MFIYLYFVMFQSFIISFNFLLILQYNPTQLHVCMLFYVLGLNCFKGVVGHIVLVEFVFYFIRFFISLTFVILYHIHLLLKHCFQCCFKLNFIFIMQLSYFIVFAQVLHFKSDP